jgi:hypothetical protein
MRGKRHTKCSCAGRVGCSLVGAVDVDVVAGAVDVVVAFAFGRRLTFGLLGSSSLYSSCHSSLPWLDVVDDVVDGVVDRDVVDMLDVDALCASAAAGASRDTNCHSSLGCLVCVPQPHHITQQSHHLTSHHSR